MSAWQINEYGGLDRLELSEKVAVPVLRRPDDVLVEIHAASVNPIDIRIVDGYGSTALNAWRRLNGVLKNGSEFPVALGRDFSGHIVETGCNVDQQKFKVGDAVWGAGGVAYTGTHAQYAAISSKEISHKPQTLTHIEAASLPYVAATTWSAVCTVSGYNERNMGGKRALVLGGSGGVGTFAIQLLKAWDAHVTTTCSSDTINKVLELGADIALDYTRHDAMLELENLPRFDLIFDAIGSGMADYCVGLLRPLTGSTYVSIVVPVLGNMDKWGLVLGASKTAAELGAAVAKGLRHGVNIRWALFNPSGEAMEAVAKLVLEGKIRPRVEKVFPFTELPAAYRKVADKHNRGKTVIDVIGAANTPEDELLEQMTKM
jgi:NADPH:quinone reductase-like Zn-dependent oxidoreductase